MPARMFGPLILFIFASGSIAAEDKVTLRESHRPGDMATVRLDFKAHGETWTQQGEKKNTAYKFSAKAALEFEERMMASPDASGRRSLRYYTGSLLETEVDGKRNQRELREHVRIMVATVRDNNPFLFSPAGPLTIAEYELVDAEAQLDSLVVGALLPPDAVRVGDTWQPSDEAIASVFNLSTLSRNEVTLKLEDLDIQTARISLNGGFAGVISSARTQQSLNGHLIFNRVRSKIERIELVETEEREPSPVAPGIQLQTGLTFTRQFDTPAKHLDDKSIEQLPLDPNPATEQLLYSQPDGEYRFYFPRGWHLMRHSARGAVLRFVAKNEVVAECHVLTAPNVAAGTHMPADEFKAQVQEALGAQFQKFIQEGEIPAPKGHWFFRLAAAGIAANRPVVWYYHLAAGPQGQQVVFIFRIDADRIDDFGAKDLAVVGTLEFGAPRTVSNQK